MTPAVADALALLYRALQAPIGIAVRSNDPARAKALLYRARSEANDPQLSRLTFRISPLAVGSEIFLLRGVDRRHEVPADPADHE